MSMKELVILSGKGGTGKTSLTAAFASISNGSVLCDADVDAADLHLLMDPDIQKSADLLGGQVAAVDFAKCSRCGYCIELCRFGAIDQKFVVDEVNCEGCGVCVDLCPEQAIDFPTKKCGEWFVSDTRYGAMVHARLGIAEENSGKLVTLVRQEAQRLTEVRQLEMIITDGPPRRGMPGHRYARGRHSRARRHRTHRFRPARPAKAPGSGGSFQRTGVDLRKQI